MLCTYVDASTPQARTHLDPMADLSVHWFAEAETTIIHRRLGMLTAQSTPERTRVTIAGHLQIFQNDAEPRSHQKLGKHACFIQKAPLTT